MTGAETRFTVEGLVIKERNVGESDRLVTLFTRELGLIRAFAAGAKNIKSKKAAATSMLTYSSFTILKKKDTYRIYEATPISQFFKIGTDIEVLALSQYFCELCYRFGEENSPEEELLRLVLNSLHFLTKANRYPPLIKAITEMRTAVICGYSPNLIACEECGIFEDNIMYFDVLQGNILCDKCVKIKNGFMLDKTMLSALRHIVYSDFNKLYSFSVPDDQAVRLSSITEAYITAQSETKFEALDFYNSIK